MIRALPALCLALVACGGAIDPTIDIGHDYRPPPLGPTYEVQVRDVMLDYDTWVTAFCRTGDKLVAARCEAGSNTGNVAPDGTMVVEGVGITCEFRNEGVPMGVYATVTCEEGGGT
jgi:hypothetical protein